MKDLLLLVGLGVGAFLILDQNGTTAGYTSISSNVTEQGATITATGYQSNMVVTASGIPFDGNSASPTGA